MSGKNNRIRIAAAGDIHMQQSIANTLKEQFSKIADEADVLILAGDLTDHGYKEEATLLANELQGLKIPVIAVLGNHDYASGQEKEIYQILSGNGINVLLDEPFILNESLGFAGTKGFGGGFDSHMLGPFGEDHTKNFVYAAVNESLMLEEQLKKIEVPKKIVITHYSPVRQTCIGEPEEIFPFLGSSRLSEPIDNFECLMAFHGHAHHGSLEGKTIKGIPVYNVSQKVLEKSTGKPFFLIDV